MIGKISRGKHFKGVLKYAAGETAKDQHAALLFENITTTEHGLCAITQDFENHARLGKTLKPVLHFSLAPTVSDWEYFRNNPDKAKALADEYLELMGFDSIHPRAVFQHNEQNGTGHFHIITTNVLRNGEIWKSSKDFYRSMEACRILEERYGFEAVSSKPADKRLVSKNEIEKYNRTSDVSPFEHIQQCIDDVLQNGLISQLNFSLLLKKANIEVRFNQGVNGLNGASFSYKGIVLKGSKLGKNYTGKGLEARGLRADEGFKSEQDGLGNVAATNFDPIPSQILMTPTQVRKKQGDFNNKFNEPKHKPTAFDLNLEPTKSGIKVVPTPQPSHKPIKLKLDTSRDRPIDADDVQAVIRIIAMEFFGTESDKQTTLDAQAWQALKKIGCKYPHQIVQKAIKKICTAHKEHGIALLRAWKKFDPMTFKDVAAQSCDDQMDSHTKYQVPSLTPQGFKERQQEGRIEVMSSSSNGSLLKSWDEMTEHEKTEYLIRKNTLKPTQRPR